MIPSNFNVEGFTNVKCDNCKETKTCLCITFSGWHEGDKFKICMDCIQKEIDEAF
jgi:hypothetical protein